MKNRLSRREARQQQRKTLKQSRMKCPTGKSGYARKIALYGQTYGQARVSQPVSIPSRVNADQTSPPLNGRLEELAKQREQRIRNMMSLGYNPFL